MRVVHILRKYNPAEWGGTETAVQRLFDGLRPCGVTPIVYCPRIKQNGVRDPLAEAGCTIKRFHACVPVFGISRAEKQQMVSVGGNLLSFDLIRSLLKEQDISLIHTHALGRLGGIGLTMAQRRKIPLVVTIHGGVLDLPEQVKRDFDKAGSRGLEWGKVFGALLHSRRLLPEADAILTCNHREAALLQKKYPHQRIQVQPHGVPMHLFEEDCREQARAAFPQIQHKQVLLAIGRIDPVKNQDWLIERAPAILFKHPNALLVLAGACTDESYGKFILRRIEELGLENNVLVTGGLPPGDPRLIGLMQEARAVVLPSISETFGLVLLEAWAAGAPVLSSRTSGACALIQHGENGWLFDLGDPQPFHEALDLTLLYPDLGKQFAAAGRKLVAEHYDIHVLADRIKRLYEELIEAKQALCHSSR